MELKKQYNWLLIIFVIWPILDIILSQQNINLPLVRYGIYSIGTFYIVKLYLVSSKNTSKLSNLSRLLLLFSLFWLVLRFLFSFFEIFNPDTNYIIFKNTVSGGFILFFSFFLVNITIPLHFLKIFLKISYILSLFFILIGIPLFGYFTADIGNQAEIFVKYFYLGSVFLLLLSPYQKIKVNIIIAIGFLLGILMMLIIARRNVVLYLGSALFFLSLVVVFSKSKIFGKRKPLLIASSIMIAISTLVFILALQFNFDLFLERADSGMDSRESVLLEFDNDFNASPLDWYIGRGPFGTFHSILGDENTSERPLIENGYYQYILQNGVIFLIPFFLLSIVGIFNGFFRSRNHLSKAAAILVLINLIDMIGYGLPFLGLKYLNLLIAFGFCFSTSIRNMDDSEIRKLIRL